MARGEGGFALERLDRIASRLDYVALLRLVVAGLANDKRSERFKDQLMGFATECRPEDAGGTKVGFDYLIGAVKGAATPSAKGAAARLLATMKPLSADQVADVRALLRRTENRTVARHLEAALVPKAAP